MLCVMIKCQGKWIVLENENESALQREWARERGVWEQTHYIDVYAGTYNGDGSGEPPSLTGGGRGNGDGGGSLTSCPLQ